MHDVGTLPMATDGTSQVRVEGVTLQYRTKDHVVTATHRVSFDVQAGDRFVLLGPSGCGKSTLLKAIGGFLRPEEGRILVRGRPVVRPGPDRIMVFQEFDQLLPWKTVRQPLTLAERLTEAGWLRKGFILGMLALAWEIGARLLADPLVLPTFSATVAALWQSLSQGDLLGGIWSSVRVLLVGYALGVALAAVLTFVAISSRFGSELLATVTSILSGLKVGWAFAWRTLIAAELVFGVASGTGGLGWFIYEHKNNLDVPAMFAGLLCISLIGLLVENLVFRPIEAATVRRWGMQA
jgi:ABC-type nitrate/sulfonate/bicarbonate transport system permease component